MPKKRTYADRAEYLKEAVSRRRKMIRAKAIEYKGGKCSRCGYDRCSDALDFHHTNGRKDFGISQEGLTRSWERVKAEIDKCWKPTAVQHGYGNQQPSLGAKLRKVQRLSHARVLRHTCVAGSASLLCSAIESNMEKI